MILRRFYDDKLAQASYLVGCAATGEALVVDPHRDVDTYVRAAEVDGVRITHVTETHIHADFVSGSRELTARTGAQLFLSDEGGPEWSYRFAGADGARPLRDGDAFRVGNVRMEALHTPGHTPEHLSLLVTDTAAADRPIGVLTGDFVFVGDVGRPDLLERAAGVEGSMEAGARTLFRSLQRFKTLPDYLQVWPGHGAGSACGKGISSVPSSTVGYERMFSWAFAIEDEDEFVGAVLAGQPEPPRYFAQMKRINRDGPPISGGAPRPGRLPAGRIDGLLREGALVVDTRSANAFAAHHLPGTVNIPLNRAFNTWGGWLIPYDTDFYLIINDACAHCVDEAVRDLFMIGLDRVAGYFGTDVLDAGEGATAAIPQLDADELRRRLGAGEITVLDVRGRSEWEAGHIPGAPNVPVGYLEERLSQLSRDRPLVVHCQSGARSAIAASLLRARGFDVLNLAGGFAEWAARGYPVERAGAARAYA